MEEPAVLVRWLWLRIGVPTVIAKGAGDCTFEEDHALQMSPLHFSVFDMQLFPRRLVNSIVPRR